jgi:hypothetical protein
MGRPCYPNVGSYSYLKTILLKPDVCRRVGRPKLRWMDGIDDDS